MSRWIVWFSLACSCGPVDSVRDSGAPAKTPNPWADRVVRFSPGPGAGFGADHLPEVVLGPPQGAGDTQGGLDVLSLGKEGTIELEFDDIEAIDGPGVDFLVFENGFTGFFEKGRASVSEDGLDWRELPCCAGEHSVYANPEQGVSATDPSVAGGDGFDLASVGLTHARFVRITDIGTNRFYAAPGGGFDLDAVAVVNGQPIPGGAP